VGYIGYDCVRYFEPVVTIPDKNVLGLPDSIFMYVPLT
jgi:anthranilate synthase component 1